MYFAKLIIVVLSFSMLPACSLITSIIEKSDDKICNNSVINKFKGKGYDDSICSSLVNIIGNELNKYNADPSNNIKYENNKKFNAILSKSLKESSDSNIDVYFDNKIILNDLKNFNDFKKDYPLSISTWLSKVESSGGKICYVSDKNSADIKVFLMNEALSFLFKTIADLQKISLLEPAGKRDVIITYKDIGSDNDKYVTRISFIPKKADFSCE